MPSDSLGSERLTLSVLAPVDRFCLFGDACFFFSFVGVEVTIAVAIMSRFVRSTSSSTSARHTELKIIDFQPRTVITRVSLAKAKWKGDAETASSLATKQGDENRERNDLNVAVKLQSGSAGDGE